MQACRQELVFMSALACVSGCGCTRVWRDAEQARMKQLVSLGTACVSVAARVWRDAEQACMKQLVSLGTACVSGCGCTKVV